MRPRVGVVGPALLGAALLSSGAASLAAPATRTGSRPPRPGQSRVPAVQEGALAAGDAAAIARRWGIRIECLRLASSGYMLELRYSVLDARRAQPLFERATRPLLRDEASGLETRVPNPPTTGALRSTYDAKAGRTYFMFFANPSRTVRPGSRAAVTIGAFRVTGIPVTEDEAASPSRAIAAAGEARR